MSANYRIPCKARVASFSCRPQFCGRGSLPLRAMIYSKQQARGGTSRRPAMPFTRDDDLRLSIRMGLTKGLRLVRGLRRQLDEEDRNRVAEAIRHHLALTGWRIEPGPRLVRGYLSMDL